MCCDEHTKPRTRTVAVIVLARYKYQVWNRSVQTLQPVTSRKQNSLKSRSCTKEKKGARLKTTAGSSLQTSPTPQNTCSLTQAGNNGRTVKDRYRKGGMSHEATFWEQLIGAAPNLNASSAPFASSHERSSRHHSGTCGCTFPVFTQQKQEP